jgi:hypothetical protein
VIIVSHIISGHGKLICIELALDCSTFIFSCCVYFYMVHYTLVLLISVTNRLSIHFEFTSNVGLLIIPFVDDWS